MTTRTETPAEYLMRKGMDPYEQVDLQAEEIERLRSERDHYRDKYMDGIVEIERLKNSRADWKQCAEVMQEDNKHLWAALEKSNNMIVEFIQMTDKPLEYRLNTVKRAQILLDAIAREALRDE